MERNKRGREFEKQNEEKLENGAMYNERSFRGGQNGIR
jgi:hypothetical protein